MRELDERAPLPRPLAVCVFDEAALFQRLKPKDTVRLLMSRPVPSRVGDRGGRKVAMLGEDRGDRGADGLAPLSISLPSACP